MNYIDILRGNLAELHVTRDAAFAEMQAAVAAAEAESRAALNDDETARFDAARANIDSIDADITATEARIAELEAVQARTKAASLAPTRMHGNTNSPFDVLRTLNFGATGPEVRKALIDSTLRAMEHKIEDGDNQAHFERVLKRHASNTAWAANILGRANPVYESAWSKMITGRAFEMTEEERTSMSVGSNTNGGFLVPTHLDPTIILTNSGTSNVIRGISRVVTLTEGSTWNGVTSAGVTASWDAELTEVSDDTPTFARVSISVIKAQALVQASIESFEDISSLASDVLMLFADARDRLEGAAHATGSGSTAPVGIFTALDANTNVEITSTTAATIGEVDIHSVYRQVPVRWRGRGTWLTNPLYSLAVKRLGTAVSSSYSGDLTAPVSERWLGRPVVESDDAPTTQTTTALDNEIVFGDFSNFVIVDKPGSFSIEFIPHMFNTTTNLPDGRRAWYAYWRNGSDSVNDVAFRLLQDKTSA